MFYLILLFLIVFTLCWGSFLNVVAYRSVKDISFFTKRSKCNFCKKIICWYDNIPVLSWILLKAKCRNCKKKISILYPFIELITLILILSLFFKIFYFENLFFISKYDIVYFLAYFLFFSALIIATRTDLQAMVIPQIFSLWFVPIGLFFAYFNFLKVNFIQSFLGAVGGYGILWIVANLFKLIAKKEGIGVGDMELLAMIGAFIGPLGVWFSILIASITGMLFGGSYLLFAKKDINKRIPFGPFLALGAVIYFFFSKQIQNFIF